MFDDSMFLKIIYEVYPGSGCTYSIEDAISVFDTFFGKFRFYRGEEHPPLKREAYLRYLRLMPTTQSGLSIRPEQYPELIDKYFNLFFRNCDYHIGHFFSGKIRDYRLNELKAAESDKSVTL